MVKLNVEDSPTQVAAKETTGDKSEREVKYLTTSEFVLLILSRQYAVENYALLKYENVRETPTFFHILLIYITLVIPFMYLQILIGQYTGRGIFNLRNISILAKGMGFTYLLEMFATLILFVMLMSAYIVYIVAALGNIGKPLEWLQCPPNVSNICFSGQEQCPDIGPCLTEDRMLSTFVYLDEVYMRLEKANLRVSPLHKVEAMFTCWFIVFLIMILPFERIKSIIKSGFTLVLLFRLVVFYTFMVHLNYWQYFKQVLEIDLLSLVSLTAWNRAITKVCVGLDLGKFSYIMFGIHSSKSRKTGALVWFSGMISFWLLFSNHIVYACAAIHVTKLANLPPSQRHLTFNPINSLLEFGLMPVAFGKLGATFSSLYFVHGAAIIFFHIALNYNFMYISLDQQYPLIKTYGLYLKPIYCLAGFTFDIFLDCMEEFTMRKDVIEAIEEFCCQFNIIILSIIIFYVYGLAKFTDDVHFMTGAPPTNFWRIMWMLTPFIAAFGMPIAAYTDTEDFTALIFRLVMMIIFYSPYIVVSTIDIIQRIRQKTLITFFRENDEWGPQDLGDRIRRKSFNPRRHLKRNNIAYVCAHQCLIHEKIPDSDKEDD